MKNKISFTKMNGAGNDFIVFDSDANKDLPLQPEIISGICHRRFGIGADGVLTIKRVAGYDFEASYFNSDGYPGSICGNGGRCLIKYAYEKGLLKTNRAEFLFNNNIFTGGIDSSENVTFRLNEPTAYKEVLIPLMNGEIIPGYCINTGSPHLVVFFKDIDSIAKSDFDKFDVFGLGRELRNHSMFAPEGLNVNFIDFAEHLVSIRTYERGVEDETLACGTGASACAIVLNKLKKFESPVTLMTRSGQELKVNFSVENSIASCIDLTGNAQINFEGEFLLNKFY